jgi:hypothetical protein
MPIGSNPEDGDVIIHAIPRNGRSVFALRSEPGPEQCIYDTRDEAIDQALMVARRESVRVWFVDGDDACQLLKDFRMRRKSARR